MSWISKEEKNPDLHVDGAVLAHQVELIHMNPESILSRSREARAGLARHLHLKTVSFWDQLTAACRADWRVNLRKCQFYFPPRNTPQTTSFVAPLHFHPCNPGKKKKKKMAPWSNCDPAEHCWKPESWVLGPVLMAVSHSLIKLPPGCVFSGPSWDLSCCLVTGKQSENLKFCLKNIYINDTKCEQEKSKKGSLGWLKSFLQPNRLCYAKV